MAQFLVLLFTVVLLSSSFIWAQSKPKLLTLMQQQELLKQLAQLQHQTEQLLAAQQSLTTIAASSCVSTVSPKSTTSKLTLMKLILLEQNVTQAAAPNKLTKKPKPQKILPKAARKPIPKVTPEPPLPQSSQIDYGKCPELEPNMSVKVSKVNEITACLENTPFSENITRESLEQHREQIALCTLSAEGWITQSGGYDYGKAENEIKSKRLQNEIEQQLLSYHPLCKTESEMKYSPSSSIIPQIQLYQACMDYWISEVCEIVVKSV